MHFILNLTFARLVSALVSYRSPCLQYPTFGRCITPVPVTSCTSNVPNISLCRDISIACRTHSARKIYIKQHQSLSPLILYLPLSEVSSFQYKMIRAPMLLPVPARDPCANHTPNDYPGRRFQLLVVAPPIISYRGYRIAR